MCVMIACDSQQQRTWAVAVAVDAKLRAISSDAAPKHGPASSFALLLRMAALEHDCAALVNNERGRAGPR